MKRNSRIETISVLFLVFLALILLAACGGGAAVDDMEEPEDPAPVDEPESVVVDLLSTITGFLIESSMNTITIQESDGSTFKFGIDGDTQIIGTEYLGNTITVSFFGDYTPGTIAVTVETIAEVDHATSSGNGNTDEADAPQSRDSSEDDKIWYMTGTVTDISTNSLKILYEDGKTYTVVIDENTKKDPGIVVGCVARVFRKGSLRDGMLATEIRFISDSSKPTPAPNPSGGSDSAPGGIAQDAKSLIGSSYKSGGTSPADGFDNSGFISYVLNRNGINCPRTIHEQISIGRQVTSYSDLKAGDLVFFGDGSGSGTAQFGGIYIGGGAMVYSSSGAGSVTQSDINQQWYKDSFVFGVSVG